jgi:hypothetical protein
MVELFNKALKALWVELGLDQSTGKSMGPLEPLGGKRCWSNIEK